MRKSINYIYPIFYLVDFTEEAHSVDTIKRERGKNAYKIDPLSAFPSEIIWGIASFLNPPENINLSYCNKFLHSQLSDIFWKFYNSQCKYQNWLDPNNHIKGQHLKAGRL